MGYHSSFTTPGSTPFAPESVEASPPWSDSLLGELRTTIQFNPPARVVYKYGSASHRTLRTGLRGWSKALWLSFLLVLGLWWMLQGRLSSRNQYQQNTLHQPKLDGLQFIDANHPYIRYVGRWLATADESHKDGSFPGVYVDFVVDGSSTVLLSLHNSELQTKPSTRYSSAVTATLPFLPLTNTSRAAPISLLVRIDDEEYIVLPNATSIVSISHGSLSQTRHEIRVIAPMAGGDILQVFQIEGIWIDEGGQLLPYQNLHEQIAQTARKMLEIVTDLPGSLAGRDRRKSIGTGRDILGGVLGWEYLLGEMFASDHVTIGMDGMCLISDCVGGRESPAGLADVFFQSGPAGSEQYSHPWFFQGYTPDVMVLNIGSSDYESFQKHSSEYNKTMWELSGIFEETYISMIKAIRALAYPKYSAASMDSSRYLDSGGVPIFVMRPFRGQLEQATHAVVDRIRKDGDKNIFWLDTSGWLNTEVDFEGRPEDQDFFLDEESPSKQWRLTERGNQRVAILLHMHVCRYLAREADKCAFLPPEIYLGSEVNHEDTWLSELLEDGGS
ncbi:LigA protein [Diplocarpon rosae]|nr:LigA protein [Diplocarpon rosae]